MRKNGRDGKSFVSHTIAVPGGFGTVTVCGDGSGITGVSFGGTPSRGEPPETLVPALGQLEEYFSGTRKSFDLELSFPGGFRGEAMRAMVRIPYGETVSYAELAAMAGSPGAARAAGNACASNPIAVVVPCHRVVRSDGSPGGYAYGVGMKMKLLGLERGDSPRPE